MLLEKLCKSEANSRSTQRTDTRSTKPKMKKRKKKERERKKTATYQAEQTKPKPNQTKPSHPPPACCLQPDKKQMPATSYQQHRAITALPCFTRRHKQQFSQSSPLTSFWMSALERNLEWNTHHCPLEEAELERWMG